MQITWQVLACLHPEHTELPALAPILIYWTRAKLITVILEQIELNYEKAPQVHNFLTIGTELAEENTTSLCTGLHDNVPYCAFIIYLCP